MKTKSEGEGREDGLRMNTRTLGGVKALFEANYTHLLDSASFQQ